MANFNIAIEKVLAHEGGYSDLAADRGGENYKGVARVHRPARKSHCSQEKKYHPGSITPEALIIHELGAASKACFRY